MNLLDEPWIPVRRASGERLWIPPHELTAGINTNPIVALDAARPDFNGALIQFFIGLVQTAWSYAGESFDSERMIREPPEPDRLKERFEPLRKAFEFDSNGPRFMQDLTLSAAERPTTEGIGSLLIEFPGEETLRKNTDHFVKRGAVEVMCPHCAAAGLLTLQVNAPGGGRGHRASLRGGGPLTTVLVYTPSGAGPREALWRTVASNVLPKHLFATLCDSKKRNLECWFPWLAPLRQLQSRDEMQPLDVHPSHLFWAMPRRIRLDFEDSSHGRCDICLRAPSRLLRRYFAKSGGLNYKGPWQHPLTPYRKEAKGESRAVQPESGGIGYRHWLGWVLGGSSRGKMVEPAKVVQHFISAADFAELRLWAFGYETDQMKARCWYEAIFPLFNVARDANGGEAAYLQQIVQWLLSGAEKACDYLCQAVRDARGGEGPKKSNPAKKSEQTALKSVKAAFWKDTEQPFFDRLEQAVRLVRSRGADALEESEQLRESWLAVLRASARSIFDRYAASGQPWLDRPERVGRAYDALIRKIDGRGLRAALGLRSSDRKSGQRAS